MPRLVSLGELRQRHGEHAVSACGLLRRQRAERDGSSSEASRPRVVHVRHRVFGSREQADGGGVVFFRRTDRPGQSTAIARWSVLLQGGRPLGCPSLRVIGTLADTVGRACGTRSGAGPRPARRGTVRRNPVDPATDRRTKLITLYGFGRIFPEGRGETKDLWVQWALEELGLPYRVHALDHTGGELDSAAYERISPFRQAPVIDDDGFVVAESAAIVLYLAEKAGKLIPNDDQGRTASSSGASPRSAPSARPWPV